MSESTVEWEGSSGKRYQYQIYSINTTLRTSPEITSRPKGRPPGEGKRSAGDRKAQSLTFNPLQGFSAGRKSFLNPQAIAALAMPAYCTDDWTA